MMQGFDQQRLVTGLILAATALFLVAVAPGFRYRRAARRAAIALYAAAAAAVVIGLIVLWLAGVAV
jgi:predicted branched-subunit amino acid permease